MIARHWRGWTKPQDADANEQLLRDTVLPAIHKVEGHRGAYLLREDGADESEFVVIVFSIRWTQRSVLRGRNIRWRCSSQRRGACGRASSPKPGIAR